MQTFPRCSRMRVMKFRLAFLPGAITSHSITMNIASAQSFVQTASLILANMPGGLPSWLIPTTSHPSQLSCEGFFFFYSHLLNKTTPIGKIFRLVLLLCWMHATIVMVVIVSSSDNWHAYKAVKTPNCQSRKGGFCMKRIITFLQPCIRDKNSDYALIFSVMNLVVGVLRLIVTL